MKKIQTLLLLLLLFLLIVPRTYGEGEYSDDFRYSITPENPLLSEDANLNDPKAVMEDLSLSKMVSYVVNLLKESVGNGLKDMTQGLALVFLSVVVNRASGNLQNQNLQMLFSFIVSISIVLLCQTGLHNCASSLQKSIEDLNVFTTACIPSFTVVMISAGEGTGAAVFSAGLVLLGELGTLVSKNLLLPLTDVYLAIGICSAVSDEYNFAAISKNIKRFVIWAIGIFTALFRTVLKLQTNAAVAGDRILQKYIRTAVGGLIPMVGGTLSQGVDSLFTVASGVKTSFAIAGVLIVLSVILPVLINIGVRGLIWSFCRWVAEFMNDFTMRSVSDVLANCFYLMLALGGCVALMSLISFLGIMNSLR